MAWGYKKPDRTESKTYHTTEVVVNSVAPENSDKSGCYSMDVEYDQ